MSGVEESPDTITRYIDISKCRVKAITANSRHDRESVTETIPPIITRKTRKGFSSEGGKGEKSEPAFARDKPCFGEVKVKAHSMRWQQRIEKNPYSVQEEFRFPLEVKYTRQNRLGNHRSRQMINVPLLAGYRIRLIDASRIKQKSR